jgi:hypothetical protein
VSVVPESEPPAGDGRHVIVGEDAAVGLEAFALLVLLGYFKRQRWV